MTSADTPEQLPAGCNQRDGDLSLRDVRKALGLSLRDVEIELGISRATLSKVERGLEPRLDVVFACSDLYGVPLSAWRVVHEYRVPASAIEATP